ncbi:mannitol dehydrogenase family protein [Nitratireductor sp. GCM10026969]|uniref:mannitol dehydrogenase family protein n=1 Tax=Nitratireductor sp. GCM10026969 TaxID=3252645 RepID=UPI00361E2FDE
MPTALSSSTLPDLADKAKVPCYDRSRLSPGIVHFGVGNFHRAHMAIYLDTLFNKGLALDWAIVGAGTRPTDLAMRERLAAQDFLTTVAEQGNDSTSLRVTGSMVDFLDPSHPDQIVARLADPSIRIVSLTVTEGGYNIDPGSGRFNPADPEVVRDVANFDAPVSVFGMIVKALDLRRSADLKPFTVMSCDNIPSNGEVTRATILGIAAMVSAQLHDWLQDNLACPNGMVDRITPATGDRERAQMRETYGIDDGSPVFCEGFKQWVLEDHFSAGRPPLEEAGVTLVEDVAPFELMKIRILNGGHAAIAYPAALLDMEFVHQAMGDELILKYFRRLQKQEIVPLVPPVPDTDINAYVDKISERFGNARMADTNRRVCFDGSNRQPKYVLPTVLDALRQGRPVEGLALISAFWCRYCAGETESGARIESNDPNWERMRETALAARDDPSIFLSMTDIFGEVATYSAYVDAFSAALSSIWMHGTRETLLRYAEAGEAV